MSTRRFPCPDVALTTGLEVLAGQYLYGDWDFDYGTPEAAVAAFMEQRPELLNSAADGIDALFQQCADEDARREVLRAADWNYRPTAPGLDAYLRGLQAQFRESEAAAAG